MVIGKDGGFRRLQCGTPQPKYLILTQLPGAEQITNVIKIAVPLDCSFRSESRPLRGTLRCAWTFDTEYRKIAGCRFVGLPKTSAPTISEGHWASNGNSEVVQLSRVETVWFWHTRFQSFRGGRINRLERLAPRGDTFGYTQPSTDIVIRANECNRLISEVSKLSLTAEAGTCSSSHWSFKYSVFASFKMGRSGSASFQRARKSWYADFALAVPPAIAYARPI